MSKTKKIAVVLFNLGGPDSLSSVKDFLFNLFFDKYIITLPTFFRYFIAKIISSRREKTAQEIYGQIGGKSPLLEYTEKQALSLEKKISTKKNTEGLSIKTFIAMRHWKPFSKDTVLEIKKYEADELILLPLYPHFSTTTSLSSIEDFIDNAKKHDLKYKNLKTICCYPTDDKFVLAHSELVLKEIEKLEDKNYRVLFSAHGLPKKIIKSGDPYQWQVEQTINKVVGLLGIENLDYKASYQSRVGPLEWIGPNTEDEIHIAGKEKKNLVIVPIAFVSEHVETLVELDIEYKHIAQDYGIKYHRVEALNMNDKFIDSLADMVISFVNQGEKDISAAGNMTRICPKNFSKCFCAK